MRKRISEWSVEKIQKHMFSGQNLEVCWKQKNNLAFFEWNQKPDSDVICNVFLGGLRILQISRRFRLSLFQLILLEASFLEQNFLHISSKKQNSVFCVYLQMFPYFFLYWLRSKKAVFRCGKTYVIEKFIDEIC